MPQLVPAILSGGSGTRLWPLSRKAHPKQFLKLFDNHSLLEHTLQRASAIPGAAAPLIIGSEEHRFLLQEACATCNIAPSAIYLEPHPRNTAPAIALAALHLAEQDPDALLLVLPSDHVITNAPAFHAAIAAAIPIAETGYLVTFGIQPSAPETGYGYVSAALDSPLSENGYPVQEFVEKPDLVTAQQYLATGHHYWNSGMFLFAAKRYLEELKTHRPEMYEAVVAAWQERQTDPTHPLFTRPAAPHFQACPADSIDYAVMQNTRHAAVVPANFGWSDVGSWSALWALAPKDETGNATSGDVYLSDTHNSYVRAESRHLSVIGLSDVIVVETADAVLVLSKSHAQKVKHIIDYLAQKNRTEHTEHKRVNRPWGWYEGIDEGERFKVKRIMVKPGEKLSLQMHHHRAEHWVVVQGTAKVTIGDKTQILAENESTFIPLGVTHRLENPGKIPLYLIEVQSGSYLGEDDIVRFEDRYGRCAPNS